MLTAMVIMASMNTWMIMKAMMITGDREAEDGGGKGSRVSERGRLPGTVRATCDSTRIGFCGKLHQLPLSNSANGEGPISKKPNHTPLLSALVYL